MNAAPTIRIHDNRKQLSDALATHVAHLAARVAELKGRFCVALSGGSLLDILAPALSAGPLRDRIAWATWQVFWADERWVPRSSPDSNFGAAWQKLLSRLSIPAERIHGMDDSESPDGTAKTYESVMRKVFQIETDEFPRFDLILLGLGEDGHTASLFPGHPALLESRRWVVPVLDAPKPPPVRMTLTLPVINYARNIIFVAGGAEKANIVAKVLDSQDAQSKLPAQMVKPMDGELRWFIDRTAASGGQIHPSLMVEKFRAGEEGSGL